MLGPEHVDDFVSGLDEEVLRWCYGGRMRAERSVVEAYVAGVPSRADALIYAVEVDGAFCGSALLFGVDGGKGEVGFWLVPGARGRGLGARVVRAMVRWGFEGLGLTRVVALTAPGNVASQATLAAAGMAPAGICGGLLRYEALA